MSYNAQVKSSGHYTNHKISPKPPTIFDFITTPIKSPIYRPNNIETQKIVISDFKNRFQQHQHQQQQQQRQQSLSNSITSTPIIVNNSTSTTNNNTSKEVASSPIEDPELKRKQYTELGSTLTKSLEAKEMEKL
jgi:hypothetical protein